jgi:hypothetical protein
VTAASALGLVGWSWRRRLPVIVLAAALITLLELRVAVTISHSRHPVYQLPRAAVITVVVAGAVATVAAIGMTLVPRPRVAIMVALVAGLCMAGVATVLGIGLLLLPVAVVAAFAIIPRLRGTRRRDWGLALLCGVPLGAGIVAVSIVSTQPPLLRCEPGTVTESERAWWGGGTGTSSGTAWVTPAPGSTATITAGERTFRYACRGTTLVSFSRPS